MKDNWNLIYDMRAVTTEDIIKNVLKHRGIINPQSFINPDESYLLPYSDFLNINKAFEIIDTTIKDGGKILIYGDVDTDGCTAASIAYRYLKNFTSNIEVFINEGKVHGITDDFNEEADTIIVVDSINNDTTMYQQILSTGKHLIVMDHHIPSEEVLNIKDDICLISSAIDNYPNPALSGAGVVWKVMKYLDTQYQTTYADNLVDLATVGIIADMCDVGETAMENRYICNLGLANICNPAIKTIVGKYEFNAKTISFSIAPLINCANRLENNDEALMLFILDDISNIKRTIENLKSYKEIQNATVNQIFTTIAVPYAEAQSANKCLFIPINGDNNFAGLIANKILGEYKKPTIVYRDNPESDYYEGSMRASGVESFTDIVNSTGLAECMGHENAAGFRILKSNLEAFKTTIEGILKDITFYDKIDIDIQLAPEQITSYLIQELKKLNRITGLGFKEVTVLINDVIDGTVESMSNGTHMKITTPDMSFIKWKLPTWEGIPLNEGYKFSGIGTLDESSFGTKKSPQMILSDFMFESVT